MIQLKVLSGKKADTEKVVRHFPFWVGRSADCGISLDDPGVWEKHFQIRLSPPDTFTLATDPKTSVVIDGKSLQESTLRNGDVIELGSVKISFGLTPTTQRSLASRELLTWIALAGLCVAQFALIYELLRQ